MILSSNPANRVAALRHDLRLEAALPVPRRLDPHRPVIGPQRLRRRPVAGVPRPARRRLAALVAEVIGQLGVHRPLDQPLGQLREQPAGPDDLLLRPSAGEQLIDQLVAEPLTQLGRQPLDPELVRRRAAIPIRSPYGLTPRDGGAALQLVGHLPWNRRHDTPLLVMPTQKIGHSPLAGKTEPAGGRACVRTTFAPLRPRRRVVARGSWRTTQSWRSETGVCRTHAARRRGPRDRFERGGGARTRDLEVHHAFACSSVEARCGARTQTGPAESNSVCLSSERLACQKARRRCYGA